VGSRGGWATRARALVSTLLVAAALVATATSTATSAALAEPPAEAAVKAEFVERFTRFVEWPADAWHKSDDPFVLCVMGEHAIGAELDKIARDRRVKGRRAVVLRPTEASEVPACHVLFVAPGESKRLVKILAQTATRPVLTVSDTGGFAAKGVLINFYRDGQHVRFEINAGAAKKTGLKLSAKLLKLARLVGAAP